MGTSDAALNIFNGLVSDMAPADLPAGASPDCADVAFISGAVMTRPGLLSMYTPIAGNPTVNYLKTYIQPNLSQTLLALDSSGKTLWGELTPGALASHRLPQTSCPLAVRAGNSATLFGREYMARSPMAVSAWDVPRQYDGTFSDRRQPGWGPGAGPASVADAPALRAVADHRHAAPTGAVCQRITP